MVRRFRELDGALLFAVLAAPHFAKAQSVSGDLNTAAQNNFARSGDIAVLERPRPLYDPLGLPLGGFSLYPNLGVETDYDDNIFAEKSGGQADTIFHIRPDVRLSSNWRRGFVTLDANASLNQYLDHPSQDTDDWSVSGRGGLNFISNGLIEADVSAAQMTEPRSAANSVSNQAAPVVYRLDAASLSASQTRNRFKFSWNASVQRFDYDNAAAIGGGFINETYRNRTVSTTSGRVDFAASPNFAVFGEAIGNVRNYDQVDPSNLKTQDASGFELLSGVNFQLTHLARGEFGVGYIDETYSNAHFGKVSGPGFRNKLQWFPTQLTTVTASFARTVEDSGIIGTPTLLLDNTGLQADHELLRNLILSAQANYTDAAYVGLPRTDERWQASAVASYLFNRNVSVNLTYTHLTQHSFGAAAGTPFDDNKMGLTLSFHH